MGVCVWVCVWSVQSCDLQQTQDAPSWASAPTAAYLHVSAKGGIGTKQDLALLVGTVVHTRQLVREAHSMLAPGVCDQQAGADFWPKRDKRQADLQMYYPCVCSDLSATEKDVSPNY